MDFIDLPDDLFVEPKKKCDLRIAITDEAILQLLKGKEICVDGVYNITIKRVGSDE